MICNGCGTEKAYWVRWNLYGERCSECSPGESVPKTGLSTDIPFNGTDQLKRFLLNKERAGLIPEKMKAELKRTVGRFEKEDLMRKAGREVNGMSATEYADKCGDLYLEEDGSTNRPDLRWEVVKDLPVERKEVVTPEVNP